jgi:hypothetical protein
MFKAIRSAVATIALGALLLVAPAHAENDSPGVAGSAGAEMQDCNCWEELLEQLQEEQPNEYPKSNDAASSLTS